MADDLKDKIKQNAEGPLSGEVDGIRMTQHNLRDQIAADKHLANKAATANPVKAFTRAKIVPPGSV